MNSQRTLITLFLLPLILVAYWFIFPVPHVPKFSEIGFILPFSVVVLLFFGFVLLFQNRKNQKLKLSGQKVNALVIELKKYSVPKGRGEFGPMVRIIVEGQYNGMMKIFKSNLLIDESQYRFPEKGESVDVFVDPQKISSYYVDLSKFKK